MLAPNTLFQNRYLIISQINKGNMGAVYLARDTRLDNDIALKETFFTASEADAREQFHREARLLSRLRHPSLPRVIDHFIEGNGQYLVMDYITGKDLEELLRASKGPFPVESALDWADQLLDVLIYLHSQEEPVIHRDIKPANMKLTPQGRIILLDFGLAKGSSASLQLSFRAATPAYAPLEQMTFQGTDARSDLYSLAVTLYHLMTGELPPIALQRKDAVWKGAPDPLIRADHINPHIPVKVADALTRAMSLQSDDRPQTAAEMRELLREATIVKIVPDVKPVEPVRLPDPPIDVHTPAKPVEDPETLPLQSPQPVEVKNDVPPPRVVAPEPVRRAKVISLKDKDSTQGARKVWLAVAGILAIATIAIFTIWVLKSKGTGSIAVPGNTFSTSSVPPSMREFEFETVKLDSRGSVTNKSKGKAKSYTEDLGNGVTIEMVEIPGGTFTMGSPDNEKDRSSDEGPQHQVTVQTFYMSKFEVTQAQWRAIAALPKDQTELNSDPSRFKGDRLPVESVSWEDAMEFCTRLSRKTGATYRLPTEAEWEYACRAGTETPFAYGETITPEWVNYDGNYPYQSAPKGAYRESTVDVGSLGVANGFGLYDMHGNVWEWCMDWYSENYYRESTSDDPTGPGTGSSRVLRGGSWYSYAQFCRSANRSRYAPTLRSFTLGFRLMRTLR